MKLFFKSFTYAFKGIKIALDQRNMKVLITCALVCITTGFVLRINTLDWCIILLCIGIVLALETMNSAIEHLVDLVEPHQNPKAGAIKDLAAGAVLLFSIVSGIIGIMIFGKYILDLISL